MAFKFEKLRVWQKAIELADDVDKLTKTFPKDEMYVLTSQMKRAADSVSLNIAEGSTWTEKCRICSIFTVCFTKRYGSS